MMFQNRREKKTQGKAPTTSQHSPLSRLNPPKKADLSAATELTPQPAVLGPEFPSPQTQARIEHAKGSLFFCGGLLAASGAVIALIIASPQASPLIAGPRLNSTEGFLMAALSAALLLVAQMRYRAARTLRANSLELDA